MGIPANPWPIWANIFHRKDRKLQETVTFLREIAVFDGLTRRDLRRVGQLIHERDYHAGEPIFEINHPAAAMFIIRSGEVEIFMPSSEGHDVSLANLSEGAFFGEVSLVIDSLRTASARARVPTRILGFSRMDLLKLLDADPIVASRIYKALATVVSTRLIATNQLLREIRGRRDGRNAA